MFTPKRISDLRSALGLTVAEFAAKMQVHRDTIYSWEKGETHPRYNDLIRLNKLAETSGVAVSA